jgi:hypothetical protein
MDATGTRRYDLGYATTRGEERLQARLRAEQRAAEGGRRRAALERDVAAKEEVHRARAYERDVTLQRRSNARRAEETREAGDRSRMAREVRQMREDEHAAAAAEEASWRQRDVRERRAAEAASVRRHAAADADAEASREARRASHSVARELLQRQPHLHRGHSEPVAGAHAHTQHHHPSDVSGDLHSKWKAEELLCMVEAAGQPLLSALSTLKRDATGRIAKESLDAVVDAMNTPDALSARGHHDRGRSGDRLHAGATQALMLELLAEVKAHHPTGEAAAAAATAETQYQHARREHDAQLAESWHVRESLEHQRESAEREARVRMSQLAVYPGHRPISIASPRRQYAGTERSRRLYM